MHMLIVINCTIDFRRLILCIIFMFAYEMHLQLLSVLPLVTKLLTNNLTLLDMKTGENCLIVAMQIDVLTAVVTAKNINYNAVGSGLFTAVYCTWFLNCVKFNHLIL